jgi:hypothetical protein
MVGGGYQTSVLVAIANCMFYPEAGQDPPKDRHHDSTRVVAGGRPHEKFAKCTATAPEAEQACFAEYQADIAQ